MGIRQPRLFNSKIVTAVVLSLLRLSSSGAQEVAPSNRPASDEVAKIVVMHQGGGLIDVAAREGVHGVIKSKTYLDEEVPPGRVSITARGILGYGQEIGYEARGLTGAAPRFFHTKAHEVLYEPVASVKGSLWSATWRLNRIAPYVSLTINGTILEPHPPDPRHTAHLEIETVPAQSQYVTARRKGTGVELKAISESEGRKLITKSTSVTARFLTLSNAESYEVRGIHNAVDVTPACGRRVGDGIFDECLGWRLMKGKQHVREF